MNDKLFVAASVIVPSYRGERRLPELLERLARQDFEGTWEVVVALDGESDGSRDILDEYRDRLPLRVVASTERRGVCATLNDAYEAAAGAVLIRCDDDLSPAPNMVRRHVEHHATTEAPVGVIGATRDVFADTPYARAYGIPANRRHLAGVYRRRDDMIWMHWAAHNSVTRETWDRAGGFDTRFSYGEDSELGFRIHESGVRIIIDPELEIEHRGPAPDAEHRIPRAFLSGASRKAFAKAHPGVRHEDAVWGSLRAWLWAAGVNAFTFALRSAAGCRRYGRAVDGLPCRNTDLAARSPHRAGCRGCRQGRISCRTGISVQLRLAGEPRHGRTAGGRGRRAVQ
ncbi:glycosyltransferase [Humibacter ginsenosidimutans]|uniref:glycosyltransferase n=1 Tax=Humibacter ginsenosidimutans TaxID=2599293 RepID=UPI001FEEEEBF|nr:glycosyltransferase [Humibacter ginsenosidimutans]